MKIQNKRKVCFAPVSDNLYYSEGTPIMINSFKKFHPDIDLVVFRQDIVDKLFKEKGINWYQAKPFFAELLEDKYDLIVNMDVDHIILDRMTEVFDKVDYEVAGPWNFNDYENASFDNITEKMYVQGGMIASTSHDFWAKWREANKDAMKYIRKENDVMNKVIYDNKFKLKIVDENKDYYGCKSLGREPEFYIDGEKTYCRGEQVVAYHFARGNVFPKLWIDDMPLVDEVKLRWKEIGHGGISIKVVSL